jgi:hypothetical protein
MAYKEKNYQVFSEAAAMAVDYIMEMEGLNGKSIAEVSQILDAQEFTAKALVDRYFISPTDLGALCNGLGIDVGITVRKVTGEEITFYPGKNFGVGDVSRPTRTAKQEVPALPDIDYTYGAGLYQGDD